ncbi:lipoprotein insertase outer membrane protein LolB, partial [Enterobacter kobei]|uniref:lipoprotein insertase outer membrane protein LolB n=1 Tax=Enterobacter kobei TaxID=208224 RepID=UPI0039BDCB0E
MLAFIVGDLRFARFGDKLQFGAAERVQQQQDVRNLSQYQTRGAFAYLSDEQKVYARFFWQQTGQDNYRLLLLNPLGSTELELIAKPGEAQITD